MSLLSVTVKRAHLYDFQAEQLNTYVTLKLQNVKSTTVTVKGNNPSWEQDFLFEISDLTVGLLIEVWNKGILWDKALGYHFIPLEDISLQIEESGTCRWVHLDAELEVIGGQVIGTKGKSGHELLIDYRFELPFDPENLDASVIQQKLEYLNNSMELEARRDHLQRQMMYNFGHSQSDDSDYKSDLSCSAGQILHAPIYDDGYSPYIDGHNARPGKDQIYAPINGVTYDDMNFDYIPNQKDNYYDEYRDHRDSRHYRHDSYSR